MKLKDALTHILESALENPKIEIDELPTGELMGTISSNSFSGNTLAHNIKLISSILDKSLPKNQRKMVKEILPLSPNEQEILDEFLREHTKHLTPS